MTYYDINHSNIATEVAILRSMNEEQRQYRLAMLKKIFNIDLYSYFKK